MGFEPMREVSPPNRLAGGRTRPLCDPSYLRLYYNHKSSFFQPRKHISLEVSIDNFLRNKLVYFRGRHTEEITENILIVFSNPPVYN